MKTINTKVRDITQKISAILLIILWIYTAALKFGNMDKNIDSMHKQFFPEHIGTLLAYLIPGLAIVATVLLFYRLKSGFILSIGLLLSFIVFIVIAFANIFPGQTCVCAGIFPRLGYMFHLYLSIIMLAIATLGLFIYRKPSSGIAENREQSRHQLFYKQHD